MRLHSHDVKYGTGSGQQSVTATEVQEDINSHWLVKAATGKICLRGEPIQCGSVIRLEHVDTKKNLHSHNFQSPLSGNQEVSCYGDKGEGDSGDNWTLVCSGKYLCEGIPEVWLNFFLNFIYYKNEDYIPCIHLIFDSKLDISYK